MSDDLEEMLDSIFHGCAIAAYCHQAAEEGNWFPDSEATKQRLNRYYEEELAKKNRAKALALAPVDSSRSPMIGGVGEQPREAEPAEEGGRLTAPAPAPRAAGR